MANKHGSYTSVWTGIEYMFDTNDYIFYDRLYKDHLGKVADGAKNKLNSIKNLLGGDTTESQMMAVGSALQAMGMNERKNEIEALREYLSTTDSIDIEELADDKKLVDCVNEAYNIQQLYSRIQKMFGEGSNITDLMNNQFKNENNPKLLESQINSFLIRASRIAFEKVRDKITKSLTAEDPSAFQVAFNDYISILHSLIQGDLSKLNFNTFRGEDLNEYLFKNLDFLKELFKDVQAFRQQFGIDILNKFLTQQYDINSIMAAFNERQKGQHMTTTMHKAVFGKTGANNSFRLASLGEYTGATISKIFLDRISALSGGGLSFSAVTKDLHAVLGLADIDAVAYKGASDFHFKFDEKYDMNKSGAMKAFADMERQYRDSGIKDKMAIYESTKLYQWTSLDGHGFHGVDYGYEGTVALLTERGYSNAHDFLQKIFNSMEGAIFQGESIYEEELKRTVLKEIGAFLFDDAWNIGNDMSADPSNFRVLHVFRLQGTLVPLSVLLIGMGKAIKKTIGDYSQFASVKIKTQESISFPNKKRGTYTREDWVQQVSDARDGFQISIKFFNNFLDQIAAFA